MKQLLFLIGVICLSNFAQGQEDVLLKEIEPTYVQDFNTLPEGSEENLTAGWSNNVTLPGWFLGSVNVANPNKLNNLNVKESWESDSTAVGSVTGFVNVGYNFETDRALAAFIANAVGNAYIGLKIKNGDESKIIKSLNIKFTGEQWSCSNTTEQSLVFSYKVNATGLEIGNDEGWTVVESLNFISPSLNTVAGKSKYINGNVEKNKKELTASFNVTVPKNGEIWLRWFDVNDKSTDHILAIDDLELTATFEEETGIEDNFRKLPLSYIFSEGQVKIQSENVLNSIRIINTAGQTVEILSDINSKEIMFDTAVLASGTYMMQILTVENVIDCLKLVK